MEADQGMIHEIVQTLAPVFQSHILTNTLVIVLIIALSLFALMLLKKGLKGIESRYLPSAFVWKIHALFKWLIVLGALLLSLQQIGIKITSLWGGVTTVLAMVAIGFVALWSVLSNLLCTLMLVIFHPFRIGDYIEIIDPAMTAGVKGRVRNINLIFTTLEDMETPGGNIQIPNNLFFHKILRKRKGDHTHSLEKQVFEEKSLLARESSPLEKDLPPEKRHTLKRGIDEYRMDYCWQGMCGPKIRGNGSLRH